MSARYYTLVSREVLEQIQNGTADMPDCLRLIRVVEAPTPDGTELVRFEDYDAPADLDDLNVEPWFTADYDPETGQRIGCHISNRRVVDRW